MKKYIYYLILFLSGTINSYLLIVLAGITYPMDFVVWTVKSFPCFSAVTVRLIPEIILFITGIPIFLLSGLMFNKFLKLNPYLMSIISSLGVLVFLSITFLSFFPGIINLLMDVVVFLTLNIGSVLLISKKMAIVKNA